jgi:hypothetical protein
MKALCEWKSAAWRLFRYGLAIVKKTTPFCAFIDTVVRLSCDGLD